MGLKLDYIEGQTPLDEDEKEGLLISSITTQQELNEFEQQNIERAIEWTLQRRTKKELILTEKFIRDLHRKMFGDVWAWAGEFRQSNKNLGEDWKQIPVLFKQLTDDCLYWITHKTYSEEEISIRYKHRLVSIHCFSNGNGRHSRLMADVLITQVFGKPVFSWNRADLNRKGGSRSDYLKAIREADRGNIKPLMEFART